MSKIYSEHTTKKGTKLPLLDLKGKPYLQVAHRLVWFIEENDSYDFQSEIIHLDMEHGEVVVKSVVSVFDSQGKIIKRAIATKCETRDNFADFIEKAETGALGRALAMLAYGTQFTGEEFNEGERLADSPIDQPSNRRTRRTAKTEETSDNVEQEETRGFTRRTRRSRK